MNIQITEINGVPIAELVSANQEIKFVQDALEIMVNSYYQGAESLIVREHHLPPAFFDLKTGLAGEILQKFSTYNARLAIIGDFEKVSDPNLRAFIHESNKAGRILFVSSLEEAYDTMTK